MTLWHQTRTTLEMIKWEHSIFALPFALTAAVLASSGWPTLPKLLWIVVCMVTARSAGMAFNRWADSDLDAANPRTAMRAIPAGLLSRTFVGWFTLVSAALFILAASQLNRLTLLLSPVVLAVVLLYSYAKRFTRWSHLVWVGGFDMLYACQDADHDRRAGLKSLPAAIGIAGAFKLARSLHLIMLTLSLWLIHLFALGPIAWIGLAIVAALLFYEHSIISPRDLTRMNAAFFTLNGIVSIVFFLFFASAALWKTVSS